MRVTVTGGAGFLGSYLCDELVARGEEVWCVDDLSRGSVENIAPLLASDRFHFIEADVSVEIPVRASMDAVLHLASPASPPDFLARPIETLRAGSHGTENALRLAERGNARFLLASTSEVYGDPLVHPQTEEYWGNVNPVGPRAVYDEAKRFAEALSTAYRTARGLDVGIVRIFNTYGPRMRPDDGRVVTNFISQALRGQSLTIYGDGRQTRSFCFVDDLVRGLVALLDSAEPGPVNLGNPEEWMVADLARLVIELTSSRSPVEYHPLPEDDPVRRQPNIDRAVRTLGWAPRTKLDDGLRRTVAWFLDRADTDLRYG